MPPVSVRRSWTAWFRPGRLARAVAIIALAGLAACASEPTHQPEAPVVAPPPVQQPTQPPVVQAPPAVEPPPVLTPPAPQAPPARVALLVPLTGQAAPVGQALLNAAQLAVFDFPDAHLTLLPKDTRGTPAGAASAAREALAEGAELVLGPLFSADVRSVAPVVAGANVDAVAFSTDREVAGGNIYLVGFVPGDEVQRVVAYAAAQGAHRFAALAPDTDYGRRVVAGFRAAVRQAGATVGPVQIYDPAKPQSMTDAVKALTGQPVAPPAAQGGATPAAADTLGDMAGLPDQADAQPAAPLSADKLGFDALLIAEGGEPLHSLAPVLTFYGINAANVRLLGTGLWDDPAVRSEPALIGAWFAAPPQDGFQRFAARYQDTFGDAPPRVASLGYDATALAAVLAGGGQPGQRFTALALGDPRGFAGVDGLFRFRAGGLPERGLAVLEVRGDGFQVVDPAPASFETGGVSAAAPGLSSGQQFGEYRVQDQPAARRGFQPVAVTGDQSVGGQVGQPVVAPH